MPKWGLSMTEGTVVEWLVEEGTGLDKGDGVVEVESEKINNAVEVAGRGRPAPAGSRGGRGAARRRPARRDRAF